MDLLVYPISSWWYPLLFPGCCCRPLFYGGDLAGFWSLGFLIKKGIRNSWRDCFTTVSNVPGIILLSFYYCRPLMKKFSRDFIPSLQQDFLYIRIYSYSVQEEIIN